MAWQYVNIDKSGLTTRLQAAKQLGLCNATFYSLVNNQKTIPAPTVKIGLRYYYNEKQMKEVTTIVGDLRKTGKLKSKKVTK